MFQIDLRGLKCPEKHFQSWTYRSEEVPVHGAKGQTIQTSSKCQMSQLMYLH